MFEIQQLHSLVQYQMEIFLVGNTTFHYKLDLTCALANSHISFFLIDS